MSGKLDITKKETVNKMIESLKEKAQENNVDLSQLNYNGSISTIVNSIDNLFKDGGEIRCENFCDIAWEYASQFGEFAGDKFEEKRWECTESAIKQIQKEFCK
jgi:hypothetical protein